MPGPAFVANRSSQLPTDLPLLCLFLATNLPLLCLLLGTDLPLLCLLLGFRCTALFTSLSWLFNGCSCLLLQSCRHLTSRTGPNPLREQCGQQVFLVWITFTRSILHCQSQCLHHGPQLGYRVRRKCGRVLKKLYSLLSVSGPFFVQ